MRATVVFLSTLYFLCVVHEAKQENGGGISSTLAIRHLLSSQKFKDAIIDMLSNNTHPSCVNSINSSDIPGYVDSIGKPRSGLLLGNLAWLGSFDTCPQLSDARYCLSNVIVYINLLKLPLPTKIGGCYPSSCGPNDVKQLLGIVGEKVKKYVTLIHEDTDCPVKKDYSIGAIVTLVLCGIILTLCLFGTVIDLLLGFTDDEMGTKNNKLTVEEVSQKIIQQDPDHLPEPGFAYVNFSNGSTPSMKSSLKEKMFATVLTKGFTHFLLCFSLVRNTTKIFDTTVPAVAITSVNGIRVISMFWVIFGHTFLFMFLTGIMENPLTLINDMKKLSLMVISNGYFSVDSFFFLSGLLVAYTGYRKLEKSNHKIVWVVIFYLHRYFRLTPSLGFVILFYSTILPNFAYTPLWNQSADNKLCVDNWWTNILYINNFYPKKFADQCIGWTWYLANDWQFFVITPIFLLAAYRYGKSGMVISIGVALALFTLIIAILIGVYDLDPMALGRIGQSVLDPSIGKTLQDYQEIIYEKPYTRIQPYLIGILLGYFMHTSYSGTRKPGWVVAIVCWLVAIVTGLSLVYAPHNTIKSDGRTWSMAEKIIYGTTERLLWPLTLSWVVYACHNNYGGIVQRFLSARFWIPLSRLTYSAYLVHPMVLSFMFSASKSTLFYSSQTIAYFFISATVLSYAVAYILAVAVEFPFANMENNVLKRFGVRG